MIAVGLDEAGRGAWAGPLVAAAVMIKDSDTLPLQYKNSIKDSKKLSGKNRKILSNYLKNTVRFGVGQVEPDEIDAMGLTAANRLAMERAMEALGDVFVDRIIIDGNINYLAGYICKISKCYKLDHGVCPDSEAMVRADDLVLEVSAASIIAKVARDDIMTEISLKYPQYGFERHVGYGTKAHRTALQEHGISPIHRKSYKPIIALINGL